LRSGVIKADDVAADLKGRDSGLREGGVALTPAQQRALAENRYPGDDSPPGYESGTVTVTDPNKPSRPPRDESQPLDDAWSRIDRDLDRKETPADKRQAVAALRAASAQGKQIIAEARAKGNADPELVKAGVRLAERITAGMARLNK
jgi:hypothetical protein